MRSLQPIRYLHTFKSMKSSNRYFLGGVLVVSALGLILNQETATAYLVEIGFSGWQWGRILTFLLPGVELALAAILLLNLSAIKVIKPILVLLSIVFVYEGVKQGMALSEFDGVLYNPSSLMLHWSGVAAIGLSVLFAVIAIWFAFQKNEQTRDLKWWWYLTLLPLLCVNFLSTPIYRDSFQTTETEVPQEFDKTFLAEEVEGDRYALFFFDVSCGHCAESAKLLATTMRGNPDIPVYAIFSAQKEQVDKFKETTNLDCHFVTLPYPELFMDLAGHAFPSAYLMEKGEVVSHRTGLFLNYNFLDKL